MQPLGKCRLTHKRVKTHRLRTEAISKRKHIQTGYLCLRNSSEMLRCSVGSKQSTHLKVLGKVLGTALPQS